MIDAIFSSAEKKMGKAIDSLLSELAKLRTGRAHPSLLEHLMVDYYGHQTPLNQVAAVSVEDARTLSVVPYERNLIPEVEKTIMQSSLGLNPVTAGQTIRIPIPPLTEERRLQMSKLVNGVAENARVGIRATRRDINQQIKQMEKDKEISEDERRKSESKVQELTNTFIAKVDSCCEAKVAGLMKV